MKDSHPVGDLFDSIAEHFDRTRNYPWKEVVEFVSGLEGKALDLGCGNGRHCVVMVEREMDVIGLDASMELLKIARENCPDGRFVRADVRKLPFREDRFDVITYIASIHHLKKGRVESLRECKRVLKEGGELLVSSWSRESDRWDIPDDQRDVMVPWTRDDGEVFQRYYHLYTLKELKCDVKTAGMRVEDRFLSSDNNYVRAVKI